MMAMTTMTTMTAIAAMTLRLRRRPTGNACTRPPTMFDHGDPSRHEVAARQRAVLILREVLKWQASEVAELLGTTVASVNSALQRARATLDAAHLEPGSVAPLDADQQELIARYVDAFERYDVSSLVTLLHDDVTFSMPPYELWLRGPVEVAGWLLGKGIGCRGSRLIPTAVNGCAAFGSYRPAPGGGHEPWSIVVLEVSGDRISAIQSFPQTA